MTPASRYAAQTDRGRARTKNEDRWIADPSLGLFMAIDGMGGHPAGELAADIIAQTFPEQVHDLLSSGTPFTDDEFVHQVQTLLCSLSNMLVEQTRGELGLEGLGATVVALLLKGQQGLIAHLGDSRAYLVRDSQLTCLTKDHTILQLLLDRGEIVPEEVAEHPSRNQVTRYVGLENTPPPDVCRLEVCRGDRLLLCSDGLTSMVDDAQLIRLLATDHEPAEVCQQLINAANDAGGRDNITVVVVDIQDRAASPENAVD